MIVVENLTRKFNGLTAVNSLNFEVKDGEIFGLLGPNGAGKTTTVRMLCCLIRPSGGSAFIDENEVGKEPDSTNIRTMVGLLPENPGLYDTLTALQNLRFHAEIHGLEPKKAEDNIKRLLKMLDLWDRKDDVVETFSKGMKQKIAIARALVHKPKYLFMDEPTAGLDPLAAKTVREFILNLKKEGRTIFITTHNLAEAEKICDRVAIFKQSLVDIGTPESLSRKLFGRKSVFQVSGPKKEWLDRIARIEGVKRALISGKEIIVDNDDPGERNPEIVRALLSLGADVRFVREKTHTLEDVYIELMGEKPEEDGVPQTEKAGGQK